MQSLPEPATGFTVTPRVRRLVALCALALVAFFVVYWLAIHTEAGQTADEAALTGGREVPEPAQQAADGMLRTVSIGSLLIATIVLSGLALARRNAEMLILPAAIIGTSLISAEICKHWLLDRPDLVLDSKLFGNSYPSGHATVFASIGFAGLAVAPARLRGAAALLAWAMAAAAGVFVVTADWHRPSDPIGSYLITLAVTAGLLALLYGRRPGLATTEMPLISRRIARRTELVGVVSAVGLFVGAVLFASLRYGPEIDWNRFHAAYLLASAAIVIAAALTVGALLRALGSPGAVRDRGPAPDESDSVPARQPDRPRQPAAPPTQRTR